MRTIFPQKLQPGDRVRIIAPARSASAINPQVLERAEKYFAQLGLFVDYGDHAFRQDQASVSSLAGKLADLHAAFVDPSVNGVMVAIGGFDSNRLLDFIDWGLIRRNPKVFAGFSDITVLNNAFFARAGLVTYAAPNFYCFGLPPETSYSIEYFRRCAMTGASFPVATSDAWYDYPWAYDESSSRPSRPNNGPAIISEGSAEGTLIGGNLCSFNLLNGTRYQPTPSGGIILTIEDDHYDSLPETFERNLQAAIHQPYFNRVKAVLVGRFQKDTNFKLDTLKRIIHSQPALTHIPVVCNLDFGHTDPKFTYPIGGTMRLEAFDNQLTMEIIRH